MKYIVLVAILLGVVLQANAKRFSRCEFVRTARRYFPANQIDDWTCIARHESNYNTRATNRNSNGSTDYGIFQINNFYWCSPGKHNICKVRCSDLLKDDISKAAACAKKIKSRQGFKAWVAWNRHCSGGKSRGASKGC